MATTPQAGSKSPTIRRILREAAEISNAPSSDYTAEPLESDLFEWHFTIRGPPNSSYSEGVYHGRIVLPPTYPLRPPSFRFMTPSGRFEANREICLSISGHHEETWQPAWGIRTAIVALRSFMETDARGQLGGYDTTDAVRRRLASESHAFRCGTCGRTNADIIKECEQRARDAAGTSQEEEEVQIPKELNMGFKDELEAQKAAAAAASASADKNDEDEETAKIAEGFVQTVPVAADAGPAASVATSSATLPGTGDARSRQPQLTQGVSQNTSTATATRTAVSSNSPQTATATRSPGRASDDGVPVWIDRAIVVLVVLLAALVLKVLFGV